ncbi:MAG: glycerate kinase type-2 family protein [Candidatus Micrarchaeales archaeon]
MFKNKEELLNDDVGNRGKVILEALEYATMKAMPSSMMENQIKLGKDNILRIKEHSFDLSNYDKIFTVIIGKAAPDIGEKLTEILGDKLTKGVIAVPQGITTKNRIGNIEVCEGTHPIPTEKSVIAGKKAIGLVQEADEKTLVIFAISGGGSASIEVPATDIEIEDIAQTTNLLLKSGATIYEINCVRKHLSRLKGGQLPLYGDGTQISIIFSDVVGNDLSSIASGPTVPDPTTFADAHNILKKHDLLNKVSERVIKRLKYGMENIITETAKPDHKIFSRIKTVLLGDNAYVCKATAEYMLKKYPQLNMVKNYGSEVTGEARRVGIEYARNIMGHNSRFEKSGEIRQNVYIWGGETTVTVLGNGVGGRNQEQALAALIALNNSKSKVAQNMTIGFFSTDGVDRIKEAAGAIVDRKVFKNANVAELKAALENNDSYNALKDLNCLLRTGTTGTNVNDIGIAVVGNITLPETS